MKKKLKQRRLQSQTEAVLSCVKMQPCMVPMQQCAPWSFAKEHLGEHALLIQEGQDAHRLGGAGLNEVQALLVVLKLHSRPVHPL